ncbi:unnamed protein product [Pseudo-nitzschia multistriata]|nr:unnamed protein product [Pseudo-nitzschia multistriata]
MFVVKDPDQFASQIIPQYFDHNKFSSFARQLNFYGFRKMQSKPIRNSDFDANTAKHVTFYNENFKRGRHDLLKKIQRSTRGGGNISGQDVQREIQQLKEKVASLEKTIQGLSSQTENRLKSLELDFLNRIDQTVLLMQQQHQQSQQGQQNQHAHYHNLRVPGNNGIGGGAQMSADVHQTAQNHFNMNGMNVTGGPLKHGIGESLDPLPYGSRGASVGTLSSLAHLMGNQVSIGMKNGVPGTPGAISGGPTLPPHPKQKQLPTQNFGGSPSMALGPMNGRMDIRNFSALSRGLSTLSRGLSAESQGGNDYLLSMLSQGTSGNFNPTPMSGNNGASNNRNGTDNNMNNNNGMDNSEKGLIASAVGSSSTEM